MIPGAIPVANSGADFHEMRKSISQWTAEMLGSKGWDRAVVGFPLAIAPPDPRCQTFLDGPVGMDVGIPRRGSRRNSKRGKITLGTTAK